MRNPVKQVPDNLIVVKVSKRKYRIAIIRNTGEGYSHFNSEPWGLTSIRFYEFISEPLDFAELHPSLAVFAAHQPTEEYSG